ncbi:MAG: cytochrome b/b6 domain-containing protein [Nitrosomonadales bacterium]|nr:cytochrome b/b6 domain-containing protein [Nitrosomonadales bacterium]
MYQKTNPIEPVQTVNVWDLFIRIFHWTLVAGFTTAFLSGEFHFPQVHALTGYLLCALLAARIYWGFTGSPYARFASFIFPPRETVAYVRGMLKGHPRHYFGHNPAGALMVFALLATLTLILATGLVTLSVIDFEGPLLFLANQVSDESSYAFRRLHKLLPYAGLALVALHIAGVAAGSLQHRENLVKAMFTGKKMSPSDSNEA